MKKVILIHILFFVFSSWTFAQKTVGGGHQVGTIGVTTPTPIGTVTADNEPNSNLVLAPTDKKVFWVPA